MKFEVTTDHITLLQNADLGWSDYCTGAPAIDGKRPYGNSSVASDVMELLEWDVPEYGTDEWDEMTSEALDIHRETLTALQILISNFTTGIQPGIYICDDGVWSRK